jgi:hypothetical protein
MPTFAPRTRRAVLLALMCGPFTLAQDPDARSVPLPGGTAPNAEVLRQLAAQLGTAPGPQFSPELLELAKKMFADGKIDPKLLQNPELMKRAREQLGQMTPEQIDAIRKQVQQPQQPPKLPDVGRLPVGRQPDPERRFPGPKPGEFGSPPDVPGDLPPFGQGFSPQPTAPRPGSALPNTPAAREAIQFWEKNIGSLNEMPAVRDALVALATSGLEAGGDGKPFWEDILKDATTGGSSSSSGLFKWLGDNTRGWSLPSGGGSGWSAPGSGWSAPSGGGFSTPSAGGLGAVGIVLLCVVGAAVIGLFFWKVLPVIQEGRTPRPLPGQGPWPVDPRDIRTRAQLVTAFEYLSVLECGPQARTWNHVTIADGLRAAVPDSAPYADALARSYEFARYTPESEPITDAFIAEARGHLCRLARVTPA